MANGYILVNNRVDDLLAIRAECFEKHALETNNQAMLSERISHSGAERLIKVANIDAAWVNSRSWATDVVWYFAQGDTIGEQVREAWSLAQCPVFDSNNDGTFDTDPERYAYWYQMWQGLL